MKDRERILALLDRPGVTRRLIAESAGVHRNTLRRVEEENWNPKAVTRGKIMAVVKAMEKVPQPEIN